MIEFTINDNYGYKDYAHLEEVLNYTLKKLNINNSTFSIILTSDDEIKDLNKVYRDKDMVTDVISFALNDNKTFSPLINVLGDIYISIPQMQRQAINYNHSEKRELSFLAVHGLLHLLGYNHENKSEESVMFNLQKEILNEKNIID